MTGFAFHKTAVKFLQVIVIKSFAQPFEAFTASCFYQRHYQQLIEKAVFRAAAFFLKFQQFIYINIFSLFAKRQSSFLQFGQHQAEMPPFFRYNRREFCDQLFFIGIFLNKGYATGSCFLFAIGMIGKNFFKAEACQV